MPTILCLGDDPEGLRVRKLTLEAAGYSVLIADTRSARVDLLQVNRIDAVILNYNLRENAFEIIQEIRKRQRKVPLLFVDATAQRPLEQWVLEELIVNELRGLLRQVQQKSPIRHAIADLMEGLARRGSRKLNRAA